VQALTASVDLATLLEEKAAMSSDDIVSVSHMEGMKEDHNQMIAQVQNQLESLGFGPPTKPEQTESDSSKAKVGKKKKKKDEPTKSGKNGKGSAGADPSQAMSVPNPKPSSGTSGKALDPAAKAFSFNPNATTFRFDPSN